MAALGVTSFSEKTRKSSGTVVELAPPEDGPPPLVLVLQDTALGAQRYPLIADQAGVLAALLVECRVNLKWLAKRLVATPSAVGVEPLSVDWRRVPFVTTFKQLFADDELL